jgi:hypothetical protein
VATSAQRERTPPEQGSPHRPLACRCSGRSPGSVARSDGNCDGNDDGRQQYLTALGGTGQAVSGLPTTACPHLLSTWSTTARPRPIEAPRARCVPDHAGNHGEWRGPNRRSGMPLRRFAAGQCSGCRQKTQASQAEGSGTVVVCRPEGLSHVASVIDRDYATNRAMRAYIQLTGFLVMQVQEIGAAMWSKPASQSVPEKMADTGR